MQTIRANEQRIKELFTELVSIDSISFSERNMACLLYTSCTKRLLLALRKRVSYNLDKWFPSWN